MCTQWLKAHPRAHRKPNDAAHAVARRRTRQSLLRSLQNPHGSAAFRLGNRHLLASDAMKAIRCYQLAAAAGHAGAQYNLGLMYLKGEGVPRGALHGLEWLAIAADNGDMKAQVLLQRIDQALLGNEAR